MKQRELFGITSGACASALIGSPTAEADGTADASTRRPDAA